MPRFSGDSAFLLLNFFTGVYLLIRFVELLPLFVAAGTPCSAGRGGKPLRGLEIPDAVNIIPYLRAMFNNYPTYLIRGGRVTNFCGVG